VRPNFADLGGFTLQKRKKVAAGKIWPIKIKHVILPPHGPNDGHDGSF